MAVTTCKKCGRELGSAARWCPDCGTPLGRSVRCRSCGNDISVYGKGCPHCGALGAAAYGPITYVVFFSILLVMLLIVAAVWFFSHRWVEQENQKMDQEFQQRQRENQEWRKQHGFDR
jgi:hypothetical protein